MTPHGMARHHMTPCDEAWPQPTTVWAIAYFSPNPSILPPATDCAIKDPHEGFLSCAAILVSSTGFFNPWTIGGLMISRLSIDPSILPWSFDPWRGWYQGSSARPSSFPAAPAFHHSILPSLLDRQHKIPASGASLLLLWNHGKNNLNNPTNTTNPTNPNSNNWIKEWKQCLD